MTDTTNWQELPFIDYLNEVDYLLEQTYGITSDDCGVERAAYAQEAGETPAEYVRWIGEKYDLEPIFGTVW